MRVEGSSSFSISINVGTARAPVENQYQSASEAVETGRARPGVAPISRELKMVGDGGRSVMRKYDLSGAGGEAPQLPTE